MKLCSNHTNYFLNSLAEMETFYREKLTEERSVFSGITFRDVKLDNTKAQKTAAQLPAGHI